MILSKLNEIIIKYAKECKSNAEYTGSFHDGEYSSLMDKLNKFKETLIIKYNLRPSEYYKLNEIEIGEPDIFSNIIEEEKIRLSKNIKL